MLSRLNKLREERAKGENGFTLIELLVVVVILGVLIAIAIPLYLNYRKGANDAAAKSDLRNAINVLEQCNSDNSTYPALTAPLATSPVAACANQKINLSAGTSITTYTIAPTAAAATAASPVTSYTMVTTNSAGTTTKSYCYNSANGGAVQTFTTVVTTC